MLQYMRAALAAACLLMATSARAEERILRFHSDVQIQKDGALEVTETIDVRSENVRINHGIYRDFPTRYQGPSGRRVHVGFQFQGASMDGVPTPAATEPLKNGVRIKVGDANTTIREGDHRFVLRYRTTRQIGRFKDYDELYWNATGNGWAFPIDVAEARIRLPAAVKFGNRAFYTGPQGSTSKYAEVAGEQPGDILFRTISSLGPNEGLTVAVAFPKGVIAEPSQASRWLDTLRDYGPIFVGIAGLIAVCAYYFVAWQRAGRDPRPGTVVPIFSPPDDLSPPAMRYLSKLSVDDRGFASALVDLGVKGHLKISEEDGGWLRKDKRSLTRLASSQPLPAPEQAMIEKLLRPGETLAMEQENHVHFSGAKEALSASLKEAYEGKLFNRNWGWAFAGLAVWLIAMWVAAAAVVAATGIVDVRAVGVSLGALTVAILLLLAIQSMEAAGKCLFSLLAFVAAAVAFVVGGSVLLAAIALGWWLPLIPPAIGLLLVISGFFWMAAPTLKGRAALDRIAGFKQYLSITERERLDRMTSPEETPELFERYLPYAIALGVENRWAKRFSGVLAAAASQGGGGFDWYSGSSSPWSSPSRFAESVGASLATSVSSASSAPGSSGGSGGGGFSGGGGGGGGGGGW
jgi:hypothetical protein